jgi:integrase
VKELPTKSSRLRVARPYVDAANAERPKVTMTMGQVIDKYRKEVMSTRASTAATETSWINNYIEPQWDTTPLESFGKPVQIVKDWVLGLDLGTKSKREIKNILLRMVRAATVWGWITDAPDLGAITVKRKKGEVTRKARVLPLDEFGKMLKHLAEPYKTMACISYFHGLRVSELFGLKWKDVDWLGQQLEIRRSVVAQIEDDTKTPRSEAVLPLSTAEIEMLKVWHVSSEFTEPDQYIFASPFQAGEKPYSFTGFKQVLWKACEDAGISRITPHSFRHSLRNWLKRNGVSAELTTEVMRHTNYNQSRQYGNDHQVSPKVREMHEKLVREAIGA